MADLEPLVALLMSIDAAEHASWQVAYSLMVWLSMVVMVPFDLAIIDSGPAAADAAAAAANTAGVFDAPADLAAGAHASLSLVGKILAVARRYLGSTGPAREAAAVLLARLLTRPGLQPRLREFVQWGAAQLAAREAGGEGGDHDEITSSFLMVRAWAWEWDWAWAWACAWAWAWGECACACARAGGARHAPRRTALAPPLSGLLHLPVYPGGHLRRVGECDEAR